MALLALVPLVAARLGLGLHLAALHVDYATRGADSRRDRLIVQRACAAQGVPLHVVRLSRKLSGANFQERARELRYGAAFELLQGQSLDVVVTAHNRDDQAETVLYRLAKYAAPSALVGMRPREEQVARPLLCVDAVEVRAYCVARAIEYGEDATNAEPRYARNALRLEVLPVLARINPRVAAGLAEAADVAAREQELLARLADEAWTRVTRLESSGSVGSVTGTPSAAMLRPPCRRQSISPPWRPSRRRCAHSACGACCATQWHLRRSFRAVWWSQPRLWRRPPQAAVGWLCRRLRGAARVRTTGRAPA